MVDKARQRKAAVKQRKAKARAQAKSEFRSWQRRKEQPKLAPSLPHFAAASLLFGQGPTISEDQLVAWFGTPEEKLRAIREKLDARKMERDA
jgi:hypothetical protein